MTAGRTLYFAIEHRIPNGSRWSRGWSLWLWTDPDPNGGRFRTYEAAAAAMAGRYREIHGEKWEARIVRVAVLPYDPEEGT